MVQQHPAGAAGTNTPVDTAGIAQDVEGFPVLDQVQADLDAVTGALERLDAGTYGTCPTCGSTIDDERLATAPATRSCRECSSG